MLFYFRLLAHADNTDLYFYIWCFFWSVRIVGSLCGPDRWFSATLGGPGGRNGARQPPPSSIVSSSSSVVSLLRDFLYLIFWLRDFVFLSLPAQCCHCLCLYIFIRPCLFDARWLKSTLGHLLLFSCAVKNVTWRLVHVHDRRCVDSTFSSCLSFPI